MSQPKSFIPKRPEIRTTPFRGQSQDSSPSSYVPQQQQTSIYAVPLRSTAGVSKSSQHPTSGRYQQAVTTQSTQNGQQPMGTYNGAIPSTPIEKSYYRDTTSPNRNFLTLQPNRNPSKNQLPLYSESPIPTSNRSVPTSPVRNPHIPIVYRSYSNSPSLFGTARRAPPVLDRYPAVFSLNEVKLTPQPGRPERHSTSAIPSVLERYPPAIQNQYAKPINRNSEPPQTKWPIIPLPLPKKQRETTKDNNYIPNRFRYPPSPTGTPNRSNSPPSPWSEVPFSPRPVSRLATPPPPPPDMKKSPIVIPPPPPPPSEMKRGPVPRPPARNPTNNTNSFIRKPSLKVKRNSSTVSATNRNVRLTAQPTSPTVTKRQGPPPRTNVPSKLLSPEENDYVFEVLGAGRQSISTAIVQLLLPSDDNETEWGLQEMTVLCFVRDQKKRSYFLEFLSLQIGRCIYSCEIYEEFDYKCVDILKFLTFEGHDSTVGVSFANFDEFQDFKDTLDKKIQAKRQRRYDRQSKAIESKTSSSTDRNIQSEQITPTKRTPKEFKKSKSIFSRRFSNSRSKREKKGKKLDKRDIGNPLNFTHVSHAGFDPQHGFQSYGDISDAYKEVFEKANISQQQLNDPDTRNFIYKFVEDYERQSVKNPTKSATDEVPPPPPMVNHMTSKSPSSSQPSQRSNANHSNGIGSYQSQNHKTPPPPPARHAKVKIPIPPPLPTEQEPYTSYVPPPPPPPMPTEQSPVTGQKRLLHPSLPEVDNARSNLLKEIQEAAKGKLKPVTSTTPPSPIPKSMDSLAGALQRALTERSQAINPDTSESESDYTYDSDEWEDE